MGQPRRAGFLDYALAHKAFLGREEASSTPGQTDQAPRPSIHGLPGPWAWGSPPLSLGTLFSSLVRAFPGL